MHSGHSILIDEICGLVFNWGLFKLAGSPREVGFNGQQRLEILERPWSVFDRCVTFKNQWSLSARLALHHVWHLLLSPKWRGLGCKMDTRGKLASWSRQRCLYIILWLFKHLKLNIFFIDAQSFSDTVFQALRLWILPITHSQPALSVLNLWTEEAHSVSQVNCSFPWWGWSLEGWVFVMRPPSVLFHTIMLVVYRLNFILWKDTPCCISWTQVKMLNMIYLSIQAQTSILWYEWNQSMIWILIPVSWERKWEFGTNSRTPFPDMDFTFMI